MAFGDDWTDWLINTPYAIYSQAMKDDEVSSEAGALEWLRKNVPEIYGATDSGTSLQPRGLPTVGSNREDEIKSRNGWGMWPWVALGMSALGALAIGVIGVGIVLLKPKKKKRRRRR